MPQSTLPVNHGISNPTLLPEVDITAADSCCADVDETIVWSRSGDLGRGLDDEVVIWVGSDRDVGGVLGEDLRGGGHFRLLDRGGKGQGV